ncbi:MAG: V-type ATP synthase subunit D [Methanobacteriota archaeon]|nr:MAG: V-type ATP synthase subunit D [Euryarchaeota archaeon]
MVLVQYKPTRSVLLQLRRTRRTAERGHKLLKLKQDALIVEFFRVLERAKAVRSNLVDKYKVAEARIAIARAIEGSIGVKSAAFALTEAPSLELKTKNVMGIIVPKIDAKAVRKRIDQRGYGIIGTSPRIDEAAEAYENLVEDVITAAEIETTMRRLIEEIEKVKRRVNALEYRVIPELKATEAFIRQRLEEMERDNFMRLKRFKST